MKPAEFWDIDLTPYETTLWITEYSKQGVVMAWNHAALNRMAKTDKFPASPLSLIGDEQRLRNLTDQESIANVKRWLSRTKQTPRKRD